MNKLLTSCLFFICIASASMAGESRAASKYTESEVKAKLIDTLSHVRSIFEAYYGPVEWKKEHAGWDLDVEFAKAVRRIQDHPNIALKDFQRIVRDFVFSTNDYHVTILFHSTEEAYLPFLIAGSQGRYFIVDIDRDKLSADTFPFQVGDEIITFDGRPIHDVVTELKETEQRSANEATDFAFAELFLTNRFAFRGHRVPRGTVMLEIRGADGVVKTHQLVWTYTAEKIGSPKDYLARFPIHRNKKSPSEQTVGERVVELLSSKNMTLPLYEHLQQVAPRLHDKATMIGARESGLPPLGVALWTCEDHIKYPAYLFMTPDRRIIGYLRIPHYDLGDNDAHDFADLIRKFEECTDLLVIDQLNNPGGIIFHAYALASMLTDRTLETPKHHMRITQEDVYGAIELLSLLEPVQTEAELLELFGTPTLFGLPISLQFVELCREHCHFILSQWEEGKSLSDPTHLFGVDAINPNPWARYTKPILVLVNHKDFSCGDFFPALLQDNNRATLLGTRTAGAGGYVRGTELKNPFGLAYMTYTGSLAKRPGNRPIEDLGVQPDIVYELTPDDLQNNYQGFVETIHETIKSMLNGKAEPESVTAIYQAQGS